MQTQIYPEISIGGAMAPIVRELPADLETPVSVYLKLAGSVPSFLLESVTGGEQLARYSFIGIHPSKAYVFRGRELEVHAYLGNERQVVSRQLAKDQDALDILRSALIERQYHSLAGLPRLAGGLVGYLGYEMIRFFEPSVQLEPHPDLPDAIFLQTDILVAFDHAFGKIVLVGNVHLDDENGYSPASIEAKLDDVTRRILAPLATDRLPAKELSDAQLLANMSQDEFVTAVKIAQEHIAAGDIFQVVLSQRMIQQTAALPFDIYRALRRLNPSPYMFFFDFVDLIGGEPFQLIGSSPELHARLEGRQASVRPIAGTRKRGGNLDEDKRLEKELLADVKERAEHVMLVDLGRNDLGRICEYGSVQVPEKMIVERYSHVMHIVSHVQGELKPEYDAFDLLRATFPAGTVSGAPKIRAMQIIDEVEPTSRGPYAGAVGYFSYDGSMDTCIAIRTMMMRGQTLTMQAGAGIVADSNPENEYQETINKLRALAVAVEMAEAATDKKEVIQ